MSIKTVLAAVLLAAVATAAYAYEAGRLNQFRINGSQIIHDDETDRVVVVKPVIATSTTARLSAGKASFSLTESSDSPYVIVLDKNVRVVDKGVQFKLSDGARYYPETGAFVADKITVQTEVAYTCKSGRLYANGVQVKSGSVCVGNGYVIACNGDKPIMYRSTEPCGYY